MMMPKIRKDRLNFQKDNLLCTTIVLLNKVRPTLTTITIRPLLVLVVVLWMTQKISLRLFGVQILLGVIAMVQNVTLLLVQLRTPYVHGLQYHPMLKPQQVVIYD